MQLKNSHFLSKVQRLYTIFFGSNPNRGDTVPELRQAIEQYAAALSDPNQDTAVIPHELQTYLDKVTRHAYKVTDQDVADLMAQGYTEDDLFEITISAALGAGRARLDYGLSALNGNPYPIKRNVRAEI